MNIIKRKYIFLTVSGILVFISLATVLVFGFKQGIDLVGGTLWQIKTTADKESLLTALPGAVITAQPETGSFVIRLKELSEPDHQKFLEEIKKKFGEVEELRFESIGPAVGQELRQKAITAFLLVILAISLYIAFAFRKVSRPVSSWKYGLITLVTLFHDALIPMGLFAVLGRFLGVEIDTTFVVAILVVMGFSVHDTIVVFDRIRENLRLQKSPSFDFENLINQSINQTLVRSINTSLTLVLVLIAMFFFGAPALKHFVLAILVGVTVGAYSSIFVASPLLTFFGKK